MARSHGNSIADSLQLSLGYADRLMAGVEESNFARFAAPGGSPIESNHPAFIFGHLSLYAPKICQQLGRDDLTKNVPSNFEAVFSKDAKCQDDPDGSIYPAMSEVVDFFKGGYANTLTALREVDDAVLQQSNPSEGRIAELFPSIGSMHGFYVGGHMMMHLGQMSAWRRMQGLGSA